jgi:hypothetical protein
MHDKLQRYPILTSSVLTMKLNALVWVTFRCPITTHVNDFNVGFKIVCCKQEETPGKANCKSYIQQWFYGTK